MYRMELSGFWAQLSGFWIELNGFWVELSGLWMELNRFISYVLLGKSCFFLFKYLQSWGIHNLDKPDCITLAMPIGKSPSPLIKQQSCLPLRDVWPAQAAFDPLLASGESFIVNHCQASPRFQPIIFHDPTNSRLFIIVAAINEVDRQHTISKFTGAVIPQNHTWWCLGPMERRWLNCWVNFNPCVFSLQFALMALLISFIISRLVTTLSCSDNWPMSWHFQTTNNKCKEVRFASFFFQQIDFPKKLIYCKHCNNNKAFNWFN